MQRWDELITLGTKAGLACRHTSDSWDKLVDSWSVVCL